MEIGNFEFFYRAKNEQGQEGEFTLDSEGRLYVKLKEESILKIDMLSAFHDGAVTVIGGDCFFESQWLIENLACTDDEASTIKTVVTAVKREFLEQVKSLVDKEGFLAHQDKNENTAKPTHVYELRWVADEGYISLLNSLDRAPLERFINRVREHDHKYLAESKSDDFDLEQFESHPLEPWVDEILGFPDLFYIDLENMLENSWTSSLEIKEIEAFYD